MPDKYAINPYLQAVSRMICSQCERAIGLIDGQIKVSEVYRHDPINDGEYCFCSIKCLLGWYQ